jgi:hypothetical protein
VADAARYMALACAYRQLAELYRAVRLYVS